LDIKEVLVSDFANRAQDAEQEVPVGGQDLQRDYQGCRANQDRKVNGKEVKKSPGQRLGDFY
jgi:hypothetical protein